MKSSTRIPVAVVNGTGYGGVELVRLLAGHAAFELVEVTARGAAGRPLREVFPHLRGGDLTLTERVERAELVLVALPDHAAVAAVPELLAAGRRVVDLSAGFRLKHAAHYPEWYGYEHDAPALLEDAACGLVEWNREAIASARLVACPGCYPTAALLALLPAWVNNLVERDVIVDAKSGVSGAGRTLALTSHFSEANEDTVAYGVAGHRHWPEIAQELERTAAGPLRLSFTPHLVPMTRGILATCYAPLRAGVGAEEVRAAYISAYGNAPFVRVVDQPPHTKWTYGSNVCYVYATVDERAGRLIAIAALDNLVKGAAGQAIQCANLMYGLSESLGLPCEGVYP